MASNRKKTKPTVKSSSGKDKGPTKLGYGQTNKNINTLRKLEKINYEEKQAKKNDVTCNKCKGWINPPWSRGDGDYRHCECQKFHIKIKGKYYVSDDEPTTTSKNKAYTYTSKNEAIEDVAIITEQWGLEPKQVSIV